MADMYMGLNKGVNRNGTGSENGVIFSTSSFAADALLKLTGTAFTTGQDQVQVTQILELFNAALLQCGTRWPLS